MTDLRRLTAAHLLAATVGLACGGANEAPSPPYINKSNPPVGSVITADGSAIEVTLSDANLKDYLHVRWLADYPPFNNNSRILEDRLLTVTGQAARDPISISPGCSQPLSSKLTQHQILLAVSDRPWVSLDEAPADSQYTTAAPGAHVVFGSWTLNLECR